MHALAPPLKVLYDVGEAAAVHELHNDVERLLVVVGLEVPEQRIV